MCLVGGAQAQQGGRAYAERKQEQQGNRGNETGADGEACDHDAKGAVRWRGTPSLSVQCNKT